MYQNLALDMKIWHVLQQKSRSSSKNL